MATFFAVFSLIVGIFVLIGLGALGRVLNLLNYEHRQTLNNIIIFLCLPALIFNAARKADLTFVYFKIGFISFLISLSTLLLALLIVRFLNLKPATKGAFLLASGVGNTGYLGYPITQLVLGTHAVIKAVFFDIFGTVVLLFTAGIYFASRYGQVSEKSSRQAPWQQALVYASPNLTALVLGFLLHNVALPSFLTVVLKALAQATIAIIMLAIGLSLTFNKSTENGTAFILIFLKLVMMPAIALFLASALGLVSQSRTVVVLQASMPVALMSFVIGDLYSLNRHFLSKVILLSTTLSLFTIPLWQLLK